MKKARATSVAQIPIESEPAPCGLTQATWALIPPVHPPTLAVGLWCALGLWTCWVTWSLLGHDAMAAALTVENGLLQNATVLCYSVSAGLFLSAAFRHAQGQATARRSRWLLALTAACLIVAGEEINWGQSLFGYETPGVLIERNLQQEVSLHNLRLPGPLAGKHWANILLWLSAIAGGIVLPAGLWLGRSLQSAISATGFPIPPWLTQGYCFVAAAIPLDGILLGMLSRDNIPSELREVTIAAGVMIWAWAVCRHGRGSSHGVSGNSPEGNGLERHDIRTQHSRRLATA